MGRRQLVYTTGGNEWARNAPVEGTDKKLPAFKPKNCSTLLCLLTRHKHSAAATAQLDEGTLTTGSLCRDLQVSELAAQNCNASADILALLRTVSTLLTVHEGPKDAQV